MIDNQMLMQDENYGELIDVLRKKNLIETANMLQKELVDMSGSQINQQEGQKVSNPRNDSDEILKRLVDKLVNNQALLEDENLNARIEKFFDNQTFQKMVENMEVVQEQSQENKEDVPQFGGVKQKDNYTSNMRSPSFGDKSIKVSQTQNSNKQKVPNYSSPERQQKQSQPNSQKAEDMPSLIHQNEQESSFFFQDSQSFLLKNLDESQSNQKSSMNKVKQQIKMMQNNIQDEYVNDDDPGYDLYEVSQQQFQQLCKQLADKYGYPQKVVKKYSQKLTQQIQQYQEEESSKKMQQVNNKQGMLSKNIKFPSELEDYPLCQDGIIYDGFMLKVIFDRERTGFEETKEFGIIINSLIAGRYEIVEYLGSAAFSKTIGCKDLFYQKYKSSQMVCMKIIENNKDYFDQSIDEIKLLKYVNCNGDVDQHHVLKMHDYFYHKEHLFIVTELLKENLYEYQKLYKEQNGNNYFSIGKLQKIAQQILKGLEYLNSLKIIHCDLKPENILIKEYNPPHVKIIDLGSSCFIHDHLSSYVQSRSYRAPEVILGCKYDYRIDIWSLGCILAELYTGNVLFQNESIQGMLARIVGIVGPIPERMFKEGRLIQNYFTAEKLIYQDPSAEQSQDMIGQVNRNKAGKLQVLVSKKSGLKNRLKTDDHLFLDFITKCLEIDPLLRLTASQALQHPWLTSIKYKE